MYGKYSIHGAFGKDRWTAFFGGYKNPKAETKVFCSSSELAALRFFGAVGVYCPAYPNRCLAFLASGNEILYLGGGFKDFSCSPLIGEDFQFDEYFSNGLKPPTSDA